METSEVTLEKKDEASPLPLRLFEIGVPTGFKLCGSRSLMVIEPLKLTQATFTVLKPIKSRIIGD